MWARDPDLRTRIPLALKLTRTRIAEYVFERQSPYVSDLQGNRNSDLVVVGPLPAGASTPADIDAFISTKAKDPKACQALLDYLKSPEAEAIYKAHGIAPVK
jgi:ABC-type molybdate transport system substrate-binding protein